MKLERFTGQAKSRLISEFDRFDFHPCVLLFGGDGVQAELFDKSCIVGVRFEIDCVGSELAIALDFKWDDVLGVAFVIELHKHEMRMGVFSFEGCVDFEGGCFLCGEDKVRRFDLGVFFVMQQAVKLVFKWPTCVDKIT